MRIYFYDLSMYMCMCVRVAFRSFVTIAFRLISDRNMSSQWPMIEIGNKRLIYRSIRLSFVRCASLIERGPIESD